MTDHRSILSAHFAGTGKLLDKIRLDDDNVGDVAVFDSLFYGGPCGARQSHLIIRLLTKKFGDLGQGWLQGTVAHNLKRGSVTCGGRSVCANATIVAIVKKAAVRSAVDTLIVVSVINSSPELSGQKASSTFQGMVVGDEKGLVASATNITSAFRSLVPLLDTCIGMPGPCPGMTWPASTWLTPCGVFWLSSPVNT